MKKSKLLEEYRSLGRLALPIIIAQMAQIATGFIDTVMAGRISALALGSIAIGTNLWIPVYLFVVGLLMATSSIVSHYYGAREFSAIKDQVWQSMIVSSVLGLLTMFVVRQLADLMGWIGIDDEIVPVARGYLDAVSWGMPAVCIYLVLRFASEGIGYTRPMMYIQLAGLVLNAILNYILMFGKLGAPAMGAIGAGWATAAVMWLNLIVLLIYIFTHHRYAAVINAVRNRMDWSKSRELFRLGFPIGLTLVSEVGMFSAVALLMGKLGVVEVAGHQVAINFTAMMFMIPLGISAATSIRVGHALGEKQPLHARFRGVAGISLAALCMFFTATILVVFPDMVVAIYTNDNEVAEMAKGLLLMAAIFQLSDGIQVSAAGALRGMKDTLYPMVISVVVYWLIGLPISYYFGISQNYGPQGLWLGLIAGLTIAAFWLSWRFNRISSLSSQA
jgi:MATE family multidrug resistance protein